MLTKKELKKLEKLLYRKSARQRIILYLVADGYSIGELVRMTVKELKGVKLPDIFNDYRDEVIDSLQKGEVHAFLYPSGRPMQHTAFYRLLGYAGEGATGRKMNQEKIRDYVKA